MDIVRLPANVPLAIKTLLLPAMLLVLASSCMHRPIAPAVNAALQREQAVTAGGAWQSLANDTSGTHCSSVVGPAQPQRQWEYPLPDEALGNCDVAPTGDIFIGDAGGNVTCIDSQGKLKWQTALAGVKKINRTAVAANQLYVADMDGTVAALTLDGKAQWTKSVLAGLGAVPAVSLSSWTEAAAAIVTDGGWLVVLDTAGKQLKRINYAYRADWGPTIIGTKLALLPTPDGELIGIDTTSFAVSKKQFAGLDLDRVAVDAKNLKVIACDDQSLTCCDASLSPLWQQQAPGNRLSSPCVGPDGTIIAASGLDRLYAYDASGSELWSAAVGDMLWGKPILDAQTNTYVFTREGTVVSFDKKGRQRWNHLLASRALGINLSPTGQMIVCTQHSLVSLAD